MMGKFGSGMIIILIIIMNKIPTVKKKINKNMKIHKTMKKMVIGSQRKRKSMNIILRNIQIMVLLN